MNPKCTGEMRIISFIYKKTVIKKILTHLIIFRTREHHQGMYPTTETVEIVRYDDGWSGYDEPVK